jgi:NTE family protein
MKRFFTFFLFLLLAVNQAFSQKVGLVLSGGGSSGMAHIGLIQALEENNIPIDYITGTSAGALIGGMYAAGFTVEEMKALATSEKFKDMTKGIIDDKYVYYFKSEEDNASWISIEFNKDSIFRASLPTNLISTYPIDFTMMENLAPASAAAGYNFDNLFVPFRCVAAEVDSKTQMIFKDGQLGEAVRASMTYPFYLKPIKKNGKLLFDGGLYNNFPADVMLRDFYPDIIIGCTVANNIKLPNEDDIIGQIKSLLMSSTNYSVPCESDILIRIPDLGVGVLNFNNVSPIIEAGYFYTNQQMPEILKRVTSRISKEERAAKRKAFLDKRPPLVFQDIVVNGLNKYQQTYVKRNIQLAYKEKAFGLEQLRRQFYRLAGDNKLKGLYPRAIFDSLTNHYRLNLDIKRNNQFRAQFGGNFSSRSINEAFIGLQYRYLGWFGLDVTGNTYFGRFYNSGQVKLRLDYPFVIPFFLEGGVCINQWDYYQTYTTFFEDKKPSYLIQYDYDAEFAIGMPADNEGKIKLSLAYAFLNNRYYQTNKFISTDTPDNTEFYGFTSKVLYERNTLNRKQYANQGRYLNVSLRYVDGLERTSPGTTSTDSVTRRIDRSWFQAKVTFDNYFNKYGSVKLGFLLEGYYSTQRFFSNYTSSLFVTSAFRPTPDSKTFFLEKFRSNRYVAGGLKIIYEIKKNLDLRLETYAFQPFTEIMRKADNTAEYNKNIEYPRLMGTAALVYNSPIGPLAITGSYYETEIKPWSVMFHFGYILFNDSALH